MAKPDFTSQQRDAIGVIDRNLIVSAGAGAGKTATLVERVFRLIASGQEPCGVDELLIVTFSRAAAQEMKNRLAKRLTEALADPETPRYVRDHIEEQLFILPRASISTIHSFCLQLISAHPERIGLAPGFDLMSEEEARLFRRDFFTEKVEEALKENGDAAALIRRIVLLGDPLLGVTPLLDAVAAAYHFLSAIPDHDKLLEATINLHRADKSGPLIEALVGPSFLRTVALLDEKLAATIDCERAALSPKWKEIHSIWSEMSKWLSDLRRREFSHVDVDHFLMFDVPALRPKAASEADEQFKDRLKDFNPLWKKRAEKFEGLTTIAVRGDFESAAKTAEIFLREIAIKWFDELFQAHLKERRLTFSHLERLALRLLENPDGSPSEVATFYRKTLKYILVDEFQDVNDLQDRILRALARPADDACGGNLFLVGDVKQSIYEFRQAEPRIFLKRFHGSTPYPDEKFVTTDASLNLTSNFRSSGRLLDEFNHLFSQLFRMETVGIEYAKGHAFTPGRAEPAEQKREVAFSLEVFPSAKDYDVSADLEDSNEAEALQVARLVQKIGPPWKDICILLRAAAGVAPVLVEAMERLSIPVYTDARLGFLSAVEVIEFQALLKTIYNPYNDVSLLGVLRNPIVGWNEEELLLLRAVNRNAAFFDNLRTAAVDPRIRVSAKSATFLRTFAAWQEKSTRAPMAEFFAYLFDELHLLERAAVRPGGDQRRRNLLHMMDQAQLFDSFLRKGLGEFLRFLDDLLENEEDFSPPSLASAGEDVVRIMTIHKSKGMEFPVVVLPFCGRKRRGDSGSLFLMNRTHGVTSRHRDEDSEVEDPPVLYQLLRKEQEQRGSGEELRLLYVALTRAREAVYMTGSISEPVDKFVAAQASQEPLTSAEILEGQRYLDVLIPTMARRFPEALANADGLSALDGIASLRIHSNESAESAAKAAIAERDALKAVSGEAPLPSQEILSSLATAIRRIDAFGEATPPPRLRAKISVSEAKRAFDATRDAETPPMRTPSAAPKEDADAWLPAILKGALPRSAADRGTAVHRYLANCDMGAIARGAASLNDELLRLTAEKLLTDEEAALVNLKDLQWFFNSDLGRRVLRTNAKLQRERPFTIRVDASELNASLSGEPVILQGVVDLLFQEPAGWTLIDFKTDFCGANGERIPALLARYEVQMQLYRLLVGRTLGVEVAEAWLVFLNGRQSIAVENSSDALRWEAVVETGALLQGEAPRRQVTYRGV
ncbi:helicase-exonuclease AddAB subunit AddA [soil metagenome]